MDIIEYEFSPTEAKTIVDATVAAGYNFRSAAPSSSSVQHLVDAMRRGEWRWHEANLIRLSSDSRLVSDGLHRLTACAMSGVPLRALVLTDDEFAAGVNTDRGRARTLAQFLAHRGVPQASTKAAIARRHAARIVAYHRGITTHAANTVYVHDDALIDYVTKHENALVWVAGRSAAGSRRGINSTGYGVFLLEARSVDHDLAGEFHEAFAHGVSDEFDPIQRLRQAAWKRYEATGRRMAIDPTIDALVKCWDLRSTGTRLQMWKAPAWDEVRFPSGYVAPLEFRDEP